MQIKVYLNIIIIIVITICTLFFQYYVANEYDVACMSTSTNTIEKNNVINKLNSLENYGESNKERNNTSEETIVQVKNSVQVETKAKEVENLGSIRSENIQQSKGKSTTVYSNKYTKGQIEVIATKLTFTEKIKFLSISNKISKPTCERLFKLSADGITSIEEQEILYTLKAILTNDDYLYIYNIFDKYKPH